MESKTENRRVMRSRYCHLYEKDGLVSLYNSLFIDAIYGTEFLGSLLDRLERPAPILDVASAYGERREAAASLLQTLFEKRMVVDDYGVEDEHLHALKERQIASRQIRTLDLIVTVRCNFACRYCYVKPGGQDRLLPLGDQTMTPQAIKMAIDIFAELSADTPGPKEIVLFGGEPTIRTDLCTLAFEYGDRRLKSQNLPILRVLVTNGGVSLDDGFLDFLARNEVFVIVSLDGRPDVHNQARRSVDDNGTFAQVLTTYRRIKRAGCRTGICVTVGRHNLEFFADDALQFVTALQPDDLSTNACLHRFGVETNPYRVDVEDYVVEFTNMVCKLRSKGWIPQQIADCLEPFANRTPKLSFCPATGCKLVATPDGKIGFCEGFMFSEHHFFDADVVGSPAFQETYEQWRSISTLDNPECLKCPALAVCGGGCQYDVYCESGSINTALDTYRCKQNLSLLEWQIWDLHRISNRYPVNTFDVVSPDPNAWALTTSPLRDDKQLKPSWR